MSLASAAALPATGSISFGGGSLQYTAKNTVDFSSEIKNSSAAVSIDTNGQRVTFAGDVDKSNVGGLTKLGLGTLVLSGNDAYAGGTAVNAGTLMATTTTAIPDGTSLSVAAGGTFIFDPTGTGALPVSAGAVVAGAPVSAVPEPGTLALLIAGAVVAFAAWRKRS